MRFVWVSVVCWAAVAARIAIADCRVSFDDYAVGELLSDKGSAGGRWTIPPEATVTNLLDATTSAMDLTSVSGEGPRLVLSEALVDRPTQFDFRARFEIAYSSPARLAVPAARCGVTLGTNLADQPAFLGLASGKWHVLSSAAVTAEVNRWYDLRVETCDIGGSAYVSYLVKQGDEYCRLANGVGSTWLRLEGDGEGFSEVEFRGDGQFAAFAGGTGSAAGEPQAYHWIGGDEGAWENMDNWSRVAGGAACGTIPTTGAVVRVDGTVKLTRGVEQATIENGVFRLGTDQTLTALAGTLTTELEFDTNRPRVGRALTVTTRPFGGIVPPVASCIWRRGSLKKVYEPGAWCETASYMPTVDDCEHWFLVAAEDEGGATLRREFFFSRLPVLYLTTDDGIAPTAQKEEHAGWVTMQGGERFKSPYDGAMTIKVRGNTTKDYPKKPWKLKLDSKAKLFDMPKSKHWVLLANYNDLSAMRNKLAADFANDIGSLGMRSTWVECVLNGDWQGLYQISEHIRIAENRVDIYDWEGMGEAVADAVAAANGFAKADKKALEAQMSEDFAWVSSGTVAYGGQTCKLGDYVEDFASITNDLSGGYLFESSTEYDEVSKFTINVGNLKLQTMLNAPEFLNTNPAMMDWCRNFLQNYANAITSVDGYSSEGRHYSAYCDEASMVSYFLVMEMLGNYDAAKKSRYFYKDRGKRLKFGPVWDFDWGVGNPVALQGSSTVVTSESYWPTEWWVQEHTESFYREWADDPWFCTRLWTVYWGRARGVFAALLADGGAMDEAFAYLLEAGRANDTLWARKITKTGETCQFEGEVARLRTFLTRRLAWLDEQFADVPTLMASLKEDTTQKRLWNASTPSTWPYVKESSMLPISFLNAPAGCLPANRALQLSVAVNNAAIVQVAVYVNGLKVGEPLVVSGGRVAQRIPLACLTAGPHAPNCIAVVGTRSDGQMVARNYELLAVDWTQAGFILRLR